MDIVEACRAFVAVGDYGSFTDGAAVARIPQSVASRRIAALERRFGAQLFNRSTRTVTLTSFGRELLPSAKRLVELAETLEHNAERARLRPFRMAVPIVCNPLQLARLIAAGRCKGLNLDLHAAEPGERAESLRTMEVRAALVAVPPGEGTWRVPLGLAGGIAVQSRALYMESLRPSRADEDARRRRVWLQPEDDVPHIRDPLTRLGAAVGLQPAQVQVANSVAAAAAEALGSTDLLLCSASQAEELDLHWRQIGELTELARGYRLVTGLSEDTQRTHTLSAAEIGRCLGAPEADRSG
ncbi:LysR family transcriptional regulator [Nocardia iowensis]|uniref:LysR family transcriptional regulator n=1 Tax=Nocardia iowensis TaxID=204891 RepID=A0ABX8RZT6_NOCIO|nr:LysR family transcriptional regulator [Nocardia iowensis]QXN94352.1 LysR family transcriptional regulator [Nocardia iowensis]